MWRRRCCCCNCRCCCCCVTQLWVKSGSVFRPKNEDEKLKRLVGWSTVLAFAPALLFSASKRQAGQVALCKFAVLRAARNTTTRRFNFYSAQRYKFETKSEGPKNGVAKRTQKWGHKVDPKMGPSLLELLMAAPFLGPLFGPAFCRDPIFEHKFGTKVTQQINKTNTSQNRQLPNNPTRDCKSAWYIFFKKNCAG